MLQYAGGLLWIKTWDVYVAHVCTFPFHRHFHPQSLCIFLHRALGWMSPVKHHTGHHFSSPQRRCALKTKKTFYPTCMNTFHEILVKGMLVIIISTHSWVVLHPLYTQNNPVPVLGRALSGSCSSHRYFFVCTNYTSLFRVSEACSTKDPGLPFYSDLRPALVMLDACKAHVVAPQLLHSVMSLQRHCIQKCHRAWRILQRLDG